MKYSIFPKFFIQRKQFPTFIPFHTFIQTPKSFCSVREHVW